MNRLIVKIVSREINALWVIIIKTIYQEFPCYV